MHLKLTIVEMWMLMECYRLATPSGQAQMARELEEFVSNFGELEHWI
jgi:hypothetical protein